MPRPRLRRHIRFCPGVFYFKPRGIPMRMLDEIVVERDELEALKLYVYDGLDQTTAAERMHISQPTFARILASAYKKIVGALIDGKAIRLEGR